MKRDSRKVELLKACLEMLWQMENSHYVMGPSEFELHYDGTTCDTWCLKTDILNELNLDDDWKPAWLERCEAGEREK